MEVETEGVLLTQCLLRSFFLYFCSCHLSPVGVFSVFVLGYFLHYHFHSCISIACVFFFIYLKFQEGIHILRNFCFLLFYFSFFFLVQLRSCINPLHTAKVFRFCFFRGNFNFFNQKLVSSVFLFVCMREFITVFFK